MIIKKSKTKGRIYQCCRCKKYYLEINHNDYPSIECSHDFILVERENK